MMFLKPILKPDRQSRYLQSGFLPGFYVSKITLLLFSHTPLSLSFPMGRDSAHKNKSPAAGALCLLGVHQRGGLAIHKPAFNNEILRGLNNKTSDVFMHPRG